MVIQTKEGQFVSSLKLQSKSCREYGNGHGRATRSKSGQHLTSTTSLVPLVHNLYCHNYALPNLSAIIDAKYWVSWRNLDDYEAWVRAVKTALSFCAVTADSKSRWPYVRNAYVPLLDLGNSRVLSLSWSRAQPGLLTWAYWTGVRCMLLRHVTDAPCSSRTRTSCTKFHLHGVTREVIDLDTTTTRNTKRAWIASVSARSEKQCEDFTMFDRARIGASATLGIPRSHALATLRNRYHCGFFLSCFNGSDVHVPGCLM